MPFVVIFLAAAAALLSYRLLETWSPRSWLPAVCRAAGWSVIALLLVNASCPGPRPDSHPVVLLDASLSMGAAGGRWNEALALARRSGDLRLVGGLPGDTTPSGGRTLLASAVAGAGSGGRPVVLITDGEIEDADAIPADLLAQTSVRVLDRHPVQDIAVTRIDGTARVTPADSVRMTVEARGFGRGAGQPLAVTASEGDRVWLHGVIRLDAGGLGRTELIGPVPGVAPGAHVLTVTLVGTGDAEPRDDTRLFLVTVVPTPGVVLLASPPTWESRFLMDVLRDVAALPLSGFLETEAGKWRRAGDLRPVARDEVARAVRQADLLVTVGSPESPLGGTRARGRLVLAPPRPGTGVPGDWYVSIAPGGPLAGVFAGLALDSFPPGTALSDLHPGPRDWVGLTAQASRRGAVHPVLVGHDSAGVRRVSIGLDGLWRWAFRGGSSEQGYRSLVATSVSWLLGGADSATGRARLHRDVVERGRPAIFEWTAGGPPAATPIALQSNGLARSDTLVFDGAGRAELQLPPGVWRYRLGGGGEGTLAVEEFSGELLPSAVTLKPHDATARPANARIPVRRWLWLFGLGMVAFSAEWLSRRRMGLR